MSATQVEAVGDDVVSEVGGVWLIEAVQSHKCEMARQSLKADCEILNSGDNGPTWCDAANVRDG